MKKQIKFDNNIYNKKYIKYKTKYCIHANKIQLGGNKCKLLTNLFDQIINISFLKESGRFKITYTDADTDKDADADADAVTGADMKTIVHDITVDAVFIGSGAYGAVYIINHDDKNLCIKVYTDTNVCDLEQQSVVAILDSPNLSSFFVKMRFLQNKDDPFYKDYLIMQCGTTTFDVFTKTDTFMKFMQKIKYSFFQKFINFIIGSVITFYRFGGYFLPDIKPDMVLVCDTNDFTFLYCDPFLSCYADKLTLCQDTLFCEFGVHTNHNNNNISLKKYLQKIICFLLYCAAIGNHRPKFNITENERSYLVYPHMCNNINRKSVIETILEKSVQIFGKELRPIYELANSTATDDEILEQLEIYIKE